MIKVRFHYTDGSTLVQTFKTWSEAVWFGHMEGDHCTRWEKVEEKA
jgi:hypothetical protein